MILDLFDFFKNEKRMKLMQDFMADKDAKDKVKLLTLNKVGVFFFNFYFTNFNLVIFLLHLIKAHDEDGIYG
jgi:hypothetical protein